MAKNAGKMAGLAALAGLAYLNRDKLGFGDKASTTGSTRAARPESTETRDEEPRRKITDYMKKAPQDTAGPVSSTPVTRSAPRVAAPKVAPEPVEAPGGDEDYSNEGRSSTAPAAPRTYMTKTPGGDAKRTEGNQPMPSLSRVEARAASNKTDAMRNASRANVAAANRMKRMAANPEAQAAERVYPEEYMVGGPSLKAIGATAKALANRGGAKLAEYSTPLLRGPEAASSMPRLSAPAKQLTGPSKADLVARDRAARATAREEAMRAENAANYGLNPEAPGYSASAGALRDKLGGADFSLGMKKGGAVKRMASGGMTSKMPSASRRGDGIASRGKTRGKIY